MLTAQLYGKTISGKTIAEIKRKASRIANGFQKVFDCMKVTDQEVGLECTFWRYNYVDHMYIRNGSLCVEC